MKQHFTCIIFVVICIFGYLSASPPKQIPNYTTHRNYNLLPANEICGINADSLADKVFGGEFVELGEFPWIARLIYKHIPNPIIKCAGVLINERYVLTAAHCVIRPESRRKEEILQVRLGEHDETTDPDITWITKDYNITADPILDVDVEEVITHEQYNTSTKHNDIAIIRMKRNINYTGYISPVCLPLNGETTPVGELLMVAGWGLTENNKTSPVKLKAGLPAVSQRQCSTIYTGARSIIPTQFCAGGRAGKDSCTGDSGGPLVKAFNKYEEKYYLEGIVSFGPKSCGTKSVPGVYTRVSEFLDWILDNMKP